MRLRTRLLLSYIAVITMTLAVISIALLLFLNARAAPPQTTYRQLAASAQASLRGFLGGGRGIGQLQQAVMSQLADFSEETAIRTLLIRSPQSPVVIFDSSGTYATGDTPAIEFTPVSPDQNIQFAPMLRNRADTTLGSFRDPEGEDWLFLSVILAPASPNFSTAIVYALPQPTQTLREALTEFGAALGTPVIQAAFMGLVIAVFMAIIVSRTIARPLLHIEDAARAVASGDYNHQVPVTGPPEVRTVAEAFNQMTQQVQAAQQAQQDFMVNISHDLKTPLTSIQGYSQAIMDGTSPNPAESASVIHEEAARLNRMVVEITDLARLQDGQLSLQIVELDLSLIVRAVAERLKIVADKTDIDLSIDVEPLPPVKGDGDRLAHVITNLLSNALKYTPRAGKVRLKTQVNNGGVELIVQDSGIGISKDDLPRIFERFYQVDKTRGPRRGTGLGLAISREIVQAHGGTISASSAGENQGATFTLWLPSEQVNTVTSGKRDTTSANQ